MNKERKLRFPQIPFFMEDVWFEDKEHRWRIINEVAHRRAGKSMGASTKANHECRHFMSEDKIYKIQGDIDSAYPKIGYVAPTKRQAREIIWDYLKDDLREFPGNHPNNSSLSITIPRPWLGDHITVNLLASKYHDRIRGTKYRVIFNDEAQDAPEKALMSSIKPALSDSFGKLYNFGTAKGKDHFYDLLVEYHERGAPIFLFPIDKSRVYDEAQIEAMRAEYTDETWNREFLCRFRAKLEGAFYYNILESLKNEPWFYNALYDPDETVYLFADVGVNKGFSCWIAQVPEEGEVVNLLDMYDDYTNLMDLKNDLDDDGFIPDVIILPHDANRTVLQKDKTATAFSMFKDVFQTSYVPEPVKKTTNLMADIDLVSRHLNMARFPSLEARSDAHTGLRYLMDYCRKKDPLTGLFTNKIDKSSGADHCADALRNGMVGLKVKDGKINRRYNFKRNRTPEELYKLSQGRSPFFKHRRSIFDIKHTSGHDRIESEVDIYELSKRVRQSIRQAEKKRHRII